MAHARTLLLVVLYVVASGSAARAASYQKTDGSIVDPIRVGFPFYEPHDYSGNNLMPGANLADASLFRAFLIEADLSGADLSGADLGRTDLSNANLTEADLSNANLSFAYLANANLSGADLSGRFANLTAADLTDAILSGADLTDANLNFANLTAADFSSANLTDARSLHRAMGDAFYDAATDFTGTGFDPVAAGWVFLPEPGAVVLQTAALLALAGLRLRRLSPPGSLEPA